MVRHRSESAKHLLTKSSRWLFSSAAATRSLSFNCLLTAASEMCMPGVMRMSTLKRRGRDRSSLTRMDKPISVAMELHDGILGKRRVAIPNQQQGAATRLTGQQNTKHGRTSGGLWG